MEGITLPPGYEIDLHPETITPPTGSYFLRGIRNWTPNEDLKINMPEVSISLQKDGKTLPLRPYGYILEIDKGGIVKAYDRDVTSEYTEEGKKGLAERSTKNDTRTYTENELEDLIRNTKSGFHNELIVNGNEIGITKAYVLEGAKKIKGLRKFKKDCVLKGIEIHIIPKLLKSNIETPKQETTNAPIEEDYSI